MYRKTHFLQRLAHFFLLVLILISSPVLTKCVFGEDYTLYPVADAYMNSSLPTTNFGASELLAINGSSCMAIFKFDLSGFSEISDGRLSLYFSGKAKKIRVFSATSHSWTEELVTWNNGPRKQTALEDEGLNTNGGVVEFIVNDYVQSNAGKVISFIVTGSSVYPGLIESREGQHPPKLTIGSDAEPESFLAVTSESFEFTAAGSDDIDFEIESNDAWSGVSNQSWITFQGATTGTGTQTVPFFVAANPHAMDRSGKIFVLGAYGSLSINIRQCGKSQALVDTDRDGVPDVVEEIVGTNGSSGSEVPDIAMPDSWTLNPAEGAVITYSINGLRSFQIEIEKNVSNSTLAPVIELSEKQSLPAIPLALGEIVAGRYSIHLDVNQPLDIPLIAPVTGYIGRNSFDVLTYNELTNQWEEYPISSVNENVPRVQVLNTGSYALKYYSSVLTVNKNTPCTGRCIPDGKTWQKAFPDLQSALSAATSGNEIWIAQGTYYPTTDNNRAQSFVIPDGVSIYGGFKGHEYFESSRRPKEYITILSGNIGDVNSNTDNSANIITCGSNVTVDGLTIRDGYSFYSYNGLTENGGAGLVAKEKSSISVNNCTFLNNTVSTMHWGGAVFFYGCRNVAISNCFFSQNNGTNLGGLFLGGKGGAVAVIGSADMSADNCSIVSCVFDQNHSAQGGAVFLSGNGSISRSLFYMNTAFEDGSRSSGGALYIENYAQITNCTFAKNSTYLGGGAIVVGDGSTVNIKNCILHNNEAVIGSDAGWGGDEIHNSGAVQMSPLMNFRTHYSPFF